LNLADLLPFRRWFGGEDRPDESRPSALLLLLEGRAVWEFSTLPLAAPWLMTRVPRGDGHPVLVLPGLLAGDATTVPLRRFLGALGYQVAGWGRGPNLGPREGVLDGMRHKLAEMHAATGRKVSLIGWSLGGVYARELARGAPGQVRQVITMGSPIYGDPATSSNAWGIYRAVSGRDGVATHERGEGPPPVPTTSNFTRTDGVVGWGCSIETKGPLTDNIEIVGATHIGLGVHPLVLYAVGDRLAQPQDQWTHFNPRGPERALYPAQTPDRQAAGG
jgi:pimeloyl-ACP methyl ester carboxylesterase